MPITAKIDSVSVEIKKGSVSIEKRIEERSTAFFTVVDTLGVLSYERGQPVEIFDPGANTIFAGFIDNPGEVRVGAVGLSLYHDITCMDNHYLADKRLVVKSYANKTLEFIVEDIMTDYLVPEGVSEGAIHTGPTFSEVILNYVKVSEAFDALKDLSGYTWFIDEAKKLYFIDRTTNLAAWNLDGVTYRPLKGSVYLKKGNPFYRNRQYIRGGTGLTTQQIETFTGDGVTVAFTVGYPISLAPTVTVNAVGQTVGIKGVDTGKQCYWNKGDATITFTAAPGAVAVVITYYGEYPLIVRADNAGEIAARAAIEGGTGIIEEIITERQHDTADAMRESAKGKLLQYCRNAEKFYYKTRDGGLSPGEFQKVTYTPYGFAAYDMLIESISITAVGEEVNYSIIAITGPAQGSWARFFSNILLRQDMMIRIGDSSLLVLLQETDNLPLARDFEAIRSWGAAPTYGWLGGKYCLLGICTLGIDTTLFPGWDEGTLVHVAHEELALAEATALTATAKGQYCWAPKTNGGALVEAVWNKFTWG